MNIRIVSFESDGKAVAGILGDGDDVVAVGTLLGEDGLSVEQLLDRWDDLWPGISVTTPQRWASLNKVPRTSIKLLAPVARPGQVFLAGSNYRDHADEMLKRDRAAGSTRPANELEEPWHSLKAGRACIVGPGAAVSVPAGCQKFDWEAELAVVIGRYASNVSWDDALDHVAGYMIANDLSARDRSRRKDAREGTTLHIDWLRHKSFAGACPTGPWITPKEQVNNPSNLPIRLSVNGELKQDSNTSFMIFDIREQIESLSWQLPLYPGDIILTGTPGGTAASHARYLQSGDEISVTIGDLGELRTTIA